MIQVGEKISVKLRLKVVEKGEPRERTLAELLTRPTVVSVYMRNNTPSCDRQNDALVAVAVELDRRGFNLIAVSRDTCGSHVKYAAKRKVTHVLVSDPDDLFATAADAVVEKMLYGRKYLGPARAAFVLATDGTVRAVIEKVDTADHAAQLREVIARLGDC